jgi:ubiquinone/menaquinone biosynthesis C-methylase UbiE
MLRLVQQKVQQEGLRVQCVRANMVQLGWLGDDTVDGAMCLFSTLGMVCGADNRHRALIHVRRVLKPGGVFVLHVHNYWYNVFFPHGLFWVLSNIARASLLRDIERGDKFFTYRGIPRMFLHTFTRRELVRTVRRAGFEIREMITLDAKRIGPLAWPWFCGFLRANGWIVVCQ